MTNTNKTLRCYRNLTNNNRMAYVQNLPGDGGTDYGYTFDAAKALPMTVAQARKFSAYCDSLAVSWFGHGPL